MKKVLIISALSISAFLTGFTILHKPTDKAITISSEQPGKNEEVKWLSYDEAIKRNAKKPRKIFIDVYTDWCGWCKKMDQATLNDPRIAGYLNKKYYAVKLNAESGKMIKYKGKDISEKDLARSIFNATGYPTTVYLDSKENLLSPVPGYLDVDILDKILHYYGEEHYKTKTWEQFQQSYSPDAN
ncbi:MAG: DUF255 domain-containing protein [Sporocytophaga sp.]|uniref:thioredoxin family protein n=1 Tax=Sporocytophaga sp. TaxID=2231183 RepID=UPI001B2E9FAB|nr:DUF255 domain-containing protein [Sporocytophaga sp.]MBO9703196.1 DUF255 domain-containing protein [Sporocytophaga sp.]